MEPRRRWAPEQDVRYCSARCRSACRPAVDAALEEAILSLLAKRRAGATLCPSEAARHVRPDDWRPLMERTRCAARRLVVAGELQILQRGAVVDPSFARGPIRLRLPK